MSDIYDEHGSYARDEALTIHEDRSGIRRMRDSFGLGHVRTRPRVQRTVLGAGFAGQIDYAARQEALLFLLDDGRLFAAYSGEGFGDVGFY